MATHSSTLAWRIPCTEEPSGLQSMGRKELDTTEQLTLSLSLCACQAWAEKFPVLLPPTYVRLFSAIYSWCPAQCQTNGEVQ